MNQIMLATVTRRGIEDGDTAPCGEGSFGCDDGPFIMVLGLLRSHRRLMTTGL
jgi:hypothetical protein